MIILRQKSFGKLDKLEAEKKGISVAELRRRRAGLDVTDSVHDVINARSGKGITNGANVGTNTDLSTFNLKDKKGYSNRGVRDINEERLKQYKKAKKNPYKSGKIRSNKSAYNKITSDFGDGIFDDQIEARRKVTDRQKTNIKKLEQEASKIKKAPVQNNLPVLVPTKPKTTSAPISTNKSSLGFGKKAMNLVMDNPKTSIALGTAALVAGGGMAYNHHKNKNKNKQ